MGDNWVRSSSLLGSVNSGAVSMDRPAWFSDDQLRPLSDPAHPTWDKGFLGEERGGEERVRQVSLWDNFTSPPVREDHPDLGEEDWFDLLYDSRMTQFLVLKDAARRGERDRDRKRRRGAGDGAGSRRRERVDGPPLNTPQEGRGKSRGKGGPPLPAGGGE